MVLVSAHRFSHAVDATEGLSLVFLSIDNDDPRWPPLKLDEI